MTPEQDKFCDNNCVWTDHHPDCKLSQQEPEWYHGIDKHGCNRFYHKNEDRPKEFNTPLYTTPPQPEQRSVSEHLEPVAWMHVMDNTEGLKANGTGIVSITQKRKHPFGKPGVDFDKSYLVTSTPLYTTPLQRKPLTDEEIGAILEGVNAYGTRLYTFARAIEVAHNIKE